MRPGSVRLGNKSPSDRTEPDNAQRIGAKAADLISDPTLLQANLRYDVKHEAGRSEAAGPPPGCRDGAGSQANSGCDEWRPEVRRKSTTPVATIQIQKPNIHEPRGDDPPTTF